ncbi:hypothetical protein JTB14_005484 [Gonioctena quinquepunctata]|nr:hypothetical protein JTB14_005484 [Gonioctena quinquepunctata]
MSPEKSRLKKKNREAREIMTSSDEAKTKKNIKKKDSKLCECGGTSRSHKAYYELNTDDDLIKYWCVGSKVDTEKKHGRELYTKDEHDKLLKQMQKFASAYEVKEMDQSQAPPTISKEEMQNGKDKPLSEADNNFIARVEKSQKERQHKLEDKEKNSKIRIKEKIKDTDKFIKNINPKDAREAGPSNRDNKRTDSEPQTPDAEQGNHSQTDTSNAHRNKRGDGIPKNKKAMGKQNITN